VRLAGMRRLRNLTLVGAARRKRRLCWWIVAVVGVLGLSAVVSDVAVRHAVATRIAAAAGKRLHTTPNVDVGGGPILPQLISGRLAQVSLSATGASIGPLTDVDLTANLTGIHLPRDGRPASIGNASATALVPRSDLAGLIGKGGLLQAGRGLPYGLTVTGVHLTNAGVEITLEASDALIT
jgi:hypothetical protein